MFKKILAVLGIAGCLLLMAQTPVKPVDGNGNEQMLGAPGRRVLYPMAPMSSTGTDVTFNTIKVVTLFCANQTASSATIDIGDDWSYFYYQVSLPANSVHMLVAQSGLTFTDGLYITASASNTIYCQVEGVE